MEQRVSSRTRLHWISIASVVALAGCGGSGSTSAAVSETPTTTVRMDMLQLMRAFPFPHSNVIFDTQGVDPEGAEGETSMSFSVYRWETTGTYAGWSGVENSALALAEMAPLLLAARACSNGRPAPVDREDWRQAVQQVVAAGEAAHKAAVSRDQDAMIEVSNTLTNACAACHDIYRDVDLKGGERCAVAGGS